MKRSERSNVRGTALCKKHIHTYLFYLLVVLILMNILCQTAHGPYRIAPGRVTKPDLSVLLVLWSDVMPMLVLWSVPMPLTVLWSVSMPLSVLRSVYVGCASG